MSLPAHLALYEGLFSSAASRVFPSGPFDFYHLAAICDRESCGGLTLHPPGVAGLGDGGHGHGLMQIDDRFYPEFCADRSQWTDPRQNILKGAQVLCETWASIRTVEGAIAAYNCGEDRVLKAMRMGLPVDTWTTHGDYSTDVLARAAAFRGGSHAE